MTTRASTKYLDLGAILTKPDPRRASETVLSRTDRASVAVVIASSIQQLHNTEWLSETWSKRDIVFPFDEQRAPGKTLDPERPYLVHHFNGAGGQQR